MSSVTDRPAGSSRAVHVPFHKPIKTIFYHSKGEPKGPARMRNGTRLHGDETISYRTANSS